MLLAIDTCGATGGVALGDVADVPDAGSEDQAVEPRWAANIQVGFANPPRPRLWFQELAGKTFSESLLASVAELLREAEASLGQLRGVVVVHGPGSFTGIRIGVSAAKGLAEGLGIPIIVVSRLQLLARMAPNGSAAAVMDAGRNEFYVGFYREGRCETEVLLTRDALNEAVAKFGLPLFVCESRVFDALTHLKPARTDTPTAVEALRLGAERFRSGDFDDVSALDANYLRRSEMEMLARIAEHAALRAAAREASFPTE